MGKVEEEITAGRRAKEASEILLIERPLMDVIVATRTRDSSIYMSW